MIYHLIFLSVLKYQINTNQLESDLVYLINNLLNVQISKEITL